MTDYPKGIKDAKGARDIASFATVIGRDLDVDGKTIG